MNVTTIRLLSLQRSLSHVPQPWSSLSRDEYYATVVSLVQRHYTAVVSLVCPAMSTFSPVGSPSSNGLRMRVCVCLCQCSTGIVRNVELICGYANVVHTSSSFRPHTHTHTHARTHARTHTHTHTQTHTHTDTHTHTNTNTHTHTHPHTHTHTHTHTLTHTHTHTHTATFSLGNTNTAQSVVTPAQSQLTQSVTPAQSVSNSSTSPN